MKSSRFFLVLPALCALFAFARDDEAAKSVAKSGRALITADRLVSDVEKLASKEFEGRGAGTPGDKKAIAWIEEQFKAIGLSPKGSDGFRQGFEGKRKLQLENVVGLLPGSDEKLKDEYIVVGAHHDHLGKRGEKGKEKIYYGADDNASGCAALIEIARAFKESGAPKRSLLFAIFDGEEIGLLGSKYFAEHPTVEKKQIVAMINLDMVSRGDLDHVCVSGAKDCPTLFALAHSAAPQESLTLDVTHDVEWRDSSDHGPFADAKIPYLYFGVEDHEDYHKPTDTPDKIVKVKFERIARLVYLTLEAAANAPPEVRPADK